MVPAMRHGEPNQRGGALSFSLSLSVWLSLSASHSFKVTLGELLRAPTQITSHDLGGGCFFLYITPPHRIPHKKRGDPEHCHGELGRRPVRPPPPPPLTPPLTPTPYQAVVLYANKEGNKRKTERADAKRDGRAAPSICS